MRDARREDREAAGAHRRAVADRAVDDDAGEAAIRDLYDTGPELDAILAPEAAAPALLAANPGLRTRTHVVDGEGVGGRVARQMLAAQLKDTVSGGAIRRLRLGDNAFDDIPWTAERRRAGGKS
jgi:hypothetical protein